MGGVCCGGRTKAAGAVTETDRPDRPLEKLVKQEPRMVRKTILHLKNVLPGLLRYVYRENACTADKRHLISPAISTIRQALVAYSRAYTDAKWFKLSLSHKEAMLLVRCYVHEYRGELLSRSTFPDEGERRFAETFVDHFTALWKRFQDANEDVRTLLKAVYWRNTADLCTFFMTTDDDAGGELSVSEIEGALHKSNVGLEGPRLRRLIAKQDTSGDMRLDFGEYIAFYVKITEKRFIEQALFSEFVFSEPTGYMKPEEFHEFLETQQGFTGDIRASLKLLHRLKGAGMATTFTTSSGGQSIGMTPRQFAEFLTSFPNDADEEKRMEQQHFPHNSVYNPKYTTRIYQDMRRPLTEYMIASSHNTYLDHGQLAGQSSCTAYQNALLLGCRCVEIDCWDGPDGEPIVYHGHTLTTKVKFYDVIKTIDKYAFKRTQYPVILSLEVHTSQQQQARMGQIMKSVFRRKLENGEFVSILQPPIAFTDHCREAFDFTPEGLKGKILVKGKILSAEDPKFRKHCELVQKMLDQCQEQSQKLHMDETRGADDVADRDDDDKQSGATNVSISGESGNLLTKGSGNELKSGTSNLKVSDVHNETTSKKDKVICMSPELSSCVWLKSVHYRGYDMTKDKGNHWDVSSFKENSFDKLCGNPRAREQFIEANKIVFARIYPGAHRVASDNFHPQHWWNVGSQIVALNYQIEYNRSEELRYNLSRFMDNGRCGYLLKTPSLRFPARKHNDSDDGIVLTVEIFQGFGLPKPNNESSGEKIDPYVAVCMNGHEADQTIKMTTRVIDDNGWNPEFFHVDPRVGPSDALQMKDVRRSTANTNGGNMFVFNIKCLDMAMLTLQVWDQDVGVGDDYIAEAVIPVNILRTGYRAVPLKSVKFVQLHALLFCKFSLQQPLRYA
eukprot:TRINITY_DN970_c0_g1_i1.p1 TRINITY_DN970_c0_g1~~TRINITY_DN970_c0_g1_i1.p1  ORF type:complete len:923 (+),score=206.00 TRINITY_DN970_c0_g1_i1:72-2771(+)